MYVKDQFRVKSVRLEVPNTILLELNDFNIVLVVVYRPPSNTLQDNVLLLEYLQTVCSNCEVILLGDFNLPNIKWTSQNCQSGLSAVERSFFNMFVSLGLHQYVRDGTFLYSDNILDLVFSSELDRVCDLKLLPPLPSCGHLIVVFDYLFQYLSSEQVLTGVNKNGLKLWKQTDFSAINRDLSRVDYDYEFSIGNVDENYNYLASVISECIQEHVPESTRKNCGPWMPKLNVNLKKNKSVAWNQYKESRRLYGRNSLDALSKLSEFQKANIALRCDSANQRATYEERLADQVTTHPKKFHKYIRNKKKSRPSVGPLSLNNKLTDNPVEMAEVLSLGFVSVYDDTPPSDIIPHQRIYGTIDSVNFDVETVRAQLKKLNSDSSPGLDSIPGVILKKCADTLADPLSQIYNKSLTQGRLPTSWKSALVTPIYKGKGARSNPLNYRPISLTSIACKTMERLITSRLRQYLNDHNVIDPCQFGFRPGYCTAEQLLLTYNEVSLWYDKQMLVDLILFDFSKAFDRVNHRLLLKKLKLLGISGNLLKWIEDFLVGRQMQVGVNGCKSTSKDVISGVPQGSVLGPLLFLIFVNHLVSSLKCHYMIFADDLKVYLGSRSASDRETLQSDIDLLSSTASDWGLIFNVDKCANLRFQRGSNPCLDNLYMLGHAPIKYVASHGDLGVTVDSQLKFHKHVEIIAGKAGGTASNFLKSTVCRTPTFMMNILTAHLRPILEYASPLWNTGYRGDLVLLESVQRRWTRNIQGLEKLPYYERLQRLDLYSVQGRLWRADMLMCWRIFHGKSKITPDKLFTMAPAVGTRGHQFKIFPVHAETEARRRSFAARVVNSWNALPEAVVQSSSIETFKRLLALSSKTELFKYGE